MYIVTIALFAAAVYFIVRANVAFGFHYRGKGEMLARAAFARTQRESPNSPDAQLSEPEFVAKFIRNGPKVWLSIVLGLGCGVLFVISGIIAAFAS